MLLRERVAYQRKKARLITTIREEVAGCGLTEVQIRIDGDRQVMSEGNHKVNISSPTAGAIEFEIAPAWFEGLDSRSDNNLRFATRLAIRSLSR